jgi:hypothetical protein
VAKKRAAKRGVASKRAASRLTAERNQERLERDLENYRAGGSIPNYVPIRGTYQSPLRGKNNKIVGYKTKKRITGYKNVDTGETVSPRYRAQLTKAFTEIPHGGPEEAAAVQRSKEYVEVQAKRRRQRTHRGISEVESYQLKQSAEGNPMSKRQVRNDPNFIALQDKLEQFTAQQRMFTADNYEQMIRGSSLDPGAVVDRRQILAAQAHELRLIVGEDPEYQQVLVDLGRRLPDDTRPVGSYQTGHIKSVVRPYYQAQEQEG